jgi:hypothetical protein
VFDNAAALNSEDRCCSTALLQESRDSVVSILLLGICKLAKDPVLLPRWVGARAEVVGEKCSACEA